MPDLDVVGVDEGGVSRRQQEITTRWGKIYHVNCPIQVLLDCRKISTG